jgi:hypothetical protein
MIGTGTHYGHMVHEPPMSDADKLAELKTLIERLDKWILCMSYDGSYVGEPSGEFKSVFKQMARVIDRPSPDDKGIPDQAKEDPLFEEVKSIRCLLQEQIDLMKEQREENRGTNQAYLHELAKGRPT